MAHSQRDFTLGIIRLALTKSLNGESNTYTQLVNEQSQWVVVQSTFWIFLMQVYCFWWLMDMLIQIFFGEVNFAINQCIRFIDLSESKYPIFWHEGGKERVQRLRLRNVQSWLVRLHFRANAVRNFIHRCRHAIPNILQYDVYIERSKWRYRFCCEENVLRWLTISRSVEIHFGRFFIYWGKKSNISKYHYHLFNKVYILNWYCVVETISRCSKRKVRKSIYLYANERQTHTYATISGEWV